MRGIDGRISDAVMMVLFVLGPILLGWGFGLLAVLLIFCEVGPLSRRSATVITEAAKWGAVAGGLIGVILTILLVQPLSAWEVAKSVLLLGVSGAGWVGFVSGIMYWFGEAQNARLSK